jgi:Rap1a immunity proteins
MKKVFCVAMIFFYSMTCASLNGTTKVVVSDVSGTELLGFCNEPESTTAFQFCLAFIVGVRDGVVLAISLREAKPILDMPKEVKQEQMREIVIKYLKDHPEALHKSAGLLVIFALKTAQMPLYAQLW